MYRATCRNDQTYISSLPPPPLSEIGLWRTVAGSACGEGKHCGVGRRDLCTTQSARRKVRPRPHVMSRPPASAGICGTRRPAESSATAGQRLELGLAVS
jgi:hypothetical protein